MPLLLVLQGEWSLLHIAARRGRAEVAEVLIDHKFDVNIKDKVLVTTCTCILIEVTTFTLSLSLSPSLPPSLPPSLSLSLSQSGWRAFDVALTQAHPNVVETMLNRGASVNIKDSVSSH